MFVENEEVGVVGYFVLIALMPGHWFGWALEWAMAITTAVLGMLLYGRFARRYPTTSILGLCALVMLMVISCAAYVGTLVIETGVSGGRDLFDLIKPMLVYFSCTLGL